MNIFFIVHVSSFEAVEETKYFLVFTLSEIKRESDQATTEGLQYKSNKKYERINDFFVKSQMNEIFNRCDLL